MAIDWEAYKKKAKKRDEYDYQKNIANNDIAPVRTTTTSKDDDIGPVKKSLFDDGYDFGDITKTILGSREKKEQKTSAFDDALTQKYSAMSLADIEKEYARVEAEEKAFKDENGGKLLNYLTKAGSYIAEGKSGTSGSATRSKSQANIDKINDLTREKEIINVYRKQRATEEHLGGLNDEQLQLLDSISESDALEDIAPINSALANVTGGDTTAYNNVTASAKKRGETSREKLYNQLKEKNPKKSDEELNEIIDNMVELRRNQVNAKEQATRNTELKDATTENAVGSAILSRGANLIGGVTGLTEIYLQRDNEYGLDTNAAGFMLTNSSNTIDEQVQLDHDWTIEVGGAEVDAFDLVYNAGTGLIDQIGRVALSGGNAYVSGAMMFSQGVTQSIIDGKEKGYSDAKALTLGLLNGTFEAISEKMSLDIILGKDGNILRKIAKSWAAEGSEGLASGWLNRIADEVANGKHSELSKMYESYINEGYTQAQALAEVICSVIGEDAETFLLEGFVGAVFGGGVEATRTISNKTSTKSEKNTVDKLVEEEVAEVTKNAAIEKSINEEISKREKEQGGKLTDENKEALRESHKAKIESGEIELSSEELSKKEIANIRKKIKDSLKNGKIELAKIEEILTPDETKQINELKETLDNTKDEQKKAEIEGKIKQLETARLENLKKQARDNKYLRTAISEYIASKTKYEDDSEITDENEKALVESAKRNANNTTETRKYIGVLRKMVRDGKRIVITNNQELLEQGDLVERNDITAGIQAEIKSLEKQLSEATTKEDKAEIQEKIIALKYFDVGGMVRVDENGVETIIINADSTQAKYTVLGHEAKHTLEKYGLNEDFDKILFKYAKAKGDLDSTRERIKSIYKNRKDVDIDSEVAAELTGKYLFEDEKFLENLMKNKSDSKVQQIIEKIKELIDDLVVRFKGTDQEKQLREVQKKFTELYNSTDADIVENTAEKNTTEEGDVKYALKDIKTPTREELENKKPIKVIDISKPKTQGTYKERRKQIKDSIEDVISKPYLNSDTKTMFFLTQKSYSHSFSNSLGEFQINAIEHIPEFIESAIFTHAEDKTHGNDYANGSYTFFAAAKTDKIQPVKLKVAEIEYKGQDLPKNIREYFEDNPQDFASVYDTVILEVEEIEESPSGSVKDIDLEGLFNNPDELSEVSVAYLLNLVNGDARKYIPKQYSSSDSGSADYVETKSKAVMTNERIDYLIEDSGAGSRQDYANYWITSISPTDFINLTTTEKTQNRDFFDSWGSEWNPESNMSTYDYMGELKKNMRQTPYLAIDINTGEVVGHEGRHRMRALEQNGITSAEIRVEFRGEDGRIIKYSPDGKRLQIKDAMQLINQFGTKQSATIKNIIPLNKDYRNEILENYGEKTAQQNDVRYSLSDSHKEKQFAIIQETNPIWDDFHTGIRSVEDINTWEEILGFNDESIGQFIWGDFSREDAEKALKEDLITIYSSHPIEKGTFVSTSYVQAREYAGGKQSSKVYSKTIPLNEVAWINGDEGQYAPVEADTKYSLSARDDIAPVRNSLRVTPEQDSEYLELAKNPEKNEARLREMVEKAANEMLSKSKLRTNDGKLRKVYHGTNTGDFTVFNPDYIGMSSGDDGFFGKGFYFAFTKGEASYYGANRIITAYLDLRNPFNYIEELLRYNGERASYGRAPDAVFAINIYDKFPDIVKDKTITAVLDWGSYDEDAKTVELSYAEFSKIFKDIVENKKFSYTKHNGEYGVETIVTSDEEIVEYEYEGEKHTYSNFGFQKTFLDDNPSVLDVAYEYLVNKVYKDIDLPNRTSFILDNNDVYTETLKERGYDGVVQSMDGDEAVVFESSQIKSADAVTYDDNGNIIPLSERFNESRDDIRYSLARQDENVDYSKSLRSIKYQPMDDLPIREDVAPTVSNMEQVETTTSDIPEDLPIREDITSNKDNVADSFELEEYPITEVKTNRGVIPIKEYRDIMAMQYGYDDYADMRKHGVRFGDKYDDDYVPLAPTREKASKQEWQEYYDMLATEDAVTTNVEKNDIVPIVDDITDTTKIDDITLRGIGQMLRETLSLTTKETKAIQEVVQKYSTTEIPNKEQLFNELKEKFSEKTWKERNEEIAEIKLILKGFKIKVSDNIKNDIADYGDWQKHNWGKLNFSKDGLTVDDIYESLSISYPGFFPSDVVNPTDQLLLISEVAGMDTYAIGTHQLDDDIIQQATDIVISEVNKYKENELAQQMAEEQSHFYRGLVEEETAEDSSAKTVKERIADEVKNARAELLMNQQLRDESRADYEKEISRLQAEYNAKRDKNTKAANNILRRIERLQRMKNDVDADYSKRISDIENRIAKLESKDYATVEQRKTKQQELRTQMENLVGDTSTWVDKKLGISYKVNTLRRNLRDIVRDANGKRDIAKADAIYDELQGKYNHNEAELNREANRIKQQFAKMKITSAEDTYIQMLGELRYNPETTLTEDVVKDFYNKHKKNIDEAKVDKAIEMARPLYDELLSRVNQVLSEQGMKEIPYRKGYFPHFTEDKQGFLAKLFNWKTKNNDIPTDIAGLTEEFNPNRSWQSFNKQRKTDTTDYSFLKGLDSYVQGSLDWIYHIEDIQKRRALENHIRYVHSEQGIKERIDAIRNNEEYDANEMQDQIDLVYKEAGNPLNNFITDFRTATNTLAGKKSSLDRGMEEMTNRKFYSTMTNLSNRVSANMVGGSISSALTNFIPITQSWGQVSPISSLKAMGETIRSTFRDDGTIDKSDFLTNRLRKSENLYKDFWDKFGDGIGILMECVDSFTSQTVWRSKYLENISKGMSENAAIKNADQFAENVLAGRSRGNNPTIFDSKNPLAKTLTVFQLEVNNQYGYMFKDMPQDLANESKRKLVQGYVTMFLGAYAYNALYSSLVGRDAAFDPIGIIEDLLRDLGFDGDDEEEEEIAPTDAILNLTNNVLEELPFVGGLLGGGRIPLSSAMPYGGITEAFEGTLQDLSEGNTEALTKEWLNPVWYLAMPMGGGQIKKSWQGLKMFDDDLPIAGSYTDSGNLRFPVEDTPLNRVQAGLFGQYANKNARKYFDDDIAPLNEKQIKEYADLDLPIADYWKYRERLKDFEKQDEKVAYINGLDVTEEQKNTLKSYLYDEEGYKEDNPEKYAFLEKEGIGFLGYKEADDETQDAWSWAFTHQDEYRHLKENGVNPEDYSVYRVPMLDFDDEGNKAYEWSFNNPEKATLGKAFSGGVKEYRQYTTDLYNIKADKDSNGKSISGSRKKKVLDYINNLDIDYGAKCILLKSEYSSEDRYNKAIVDYLNSRDDITTEEKRTILEELGATIDSNGYIHW